MSDPTELRSAIGSLRDAVEAVMRAVSAPMARERDGHLLDARALLEYVDSACEAFDTGVDPEGDRTDE